ncbi:protein-tyrosine phosphatase-like protein [Suillus paluster]|uniref:protein-tyrosine phosphatase-like protein n=1 Tax=Suillus paluster TaxID=48578 RepID=UPI001B871C8B|nr:protein-tyrosine phosphatase-like protein [Suillus paluster]KAG1726086.1 protein-tyrosine phosphatase-like protein [Suillus paluster]
MISFPSNSWQSSFIQKKTSRRPRNDNDPSHGRAATAITPRLYLTDLYTARLPGNLTRLGITHIVSAIDFDITDVFPRHVQVLHVPVRDSADVQICEWFDPVVKFIKEALDKEDTKVLVHCFQGISRSPILICAYLVATTPMRALDSIEHVQAKRGIVCPNIGFRRQLIIWGRQFEEVKIRAEEERRRKRRSISGVTEVLAKMVRRSKSAPVPAPAPLEDLEEMSIEGTKVASLMEAKTVALGTFRKTKKTEE